MEAGPGSGRAGLRSVLADLRPRLVPELYVFTTVAGPPEGARWVALVAEDEGLTCVLPQADADRMGLGYENVWAMVTLGTTTSLELVGLTACVATALAQEGISCNVIAGRSHDHLFVPAPRAAQTLRLLGALAGSGQAGAD